MQLIKKTFFCQFSDLVLNFTLKDDLFFWVDDNIRKTENPFTFTKAEINWL